MAKATEKQAELSYGGYGLLFDPRGEVQAFLDKYQPLDNLVADVDRAASLGRASHNLTGDKHNVALPIPNWPDRPPLKINQLYWPTGATRWSIGFFLISDATRKALETSIGTARSFRFYDGIHTELEAELFMLAPRQVTAPASSRVERLWIMPLVDERYWWQFKAIEELELTTSSTWATLTTEITDILGSVTESTVGTPYGIPDPEQFSRAYENVAVMLDALAWSTGRRVARWHDGTIRVDNPADALTVLQDTNLQGDKKWYRIAGESFDKGNPAAATVRVTYPRLCDRIPVPAKLYKVDKTPTGDFANIKTISDAKHVIHSAAWARTTSRANLATTPANDTFLTDLATQLSADFYAWHHYNYDITYQGIKPWKTTGYDDHVLYSFGALECDKIRHVGEVQEDGRSVVVTSTAARSLGVNVRIVSLPYNCRVMHNLSQDKVNVVLRGIQIGYATATITRAAPSTCQIVHQAAGATTYSKLKDYNTTDVTVTAGPGAAQAAASILTNYAVVLSPCADGRWEIIGGGCAVKDWTVT